MPTTPLNPNQMRLLMSSLNPARTSKRKQGGTELTYLEAWDVKAMLIRVFGFGGFSADVVQSEVIYKEAIDKKGRDNTTYKQWKVSVQSTVRLYIKQLDASFTESAVGDGNMSDLSEALDKALKTASSDALKRCAIYLGTQFGLSLYKNGQSGDVVQMVVAPDQEYWNGQPQGKPVGVAQEAQSQQVEQQPAQPVAAQQEPAQAQQGEFERHEGVTDEQHAANLRVMNQLNAQMVQEQNAQQ